MARTNGPSGFIRGKLGKLVYYVRNGKQQVRELGIITKAPSVAQLKVRKGMSMVVTFVKPIIAFVNRGFIISAKELSTGKTPYNMAIGYNIKNALTIVNNKVLIDYAKALVAKGCLKEAVEPGAVLTANGLQFTWLCPEDEDWSYYQDEVMMLAYFPKFKKGFYNLAGAKRLVCTDFLPIPAKLITERMEVFVTFISNDRKKSANSSYLGRIN